jgi:hypothetical protein
MSALSHPRLGVTFIGVRVRGKDTKVPDRVTLGRWHESDLETVVGE